MFVLSAVMTQNPLQSANAAVNAALQFNGTSQYATLGAASQLRRPPFTLELWVKRAGRGSRRRAPGAVASHAYPLVTKGRAEARRPPRT